MWKSSIWPIDRSQSYAITPSQSETGSNGSKGVLHIQRIAQSAGAVEYTDCTCAEG